MSMPRVGGWEGGAQVPQFILDDCVARGEGATCRLICTQPRRISAVGVAERVAGERCEAVGGTVGYRILLEARESAATRLCFCTTGVLLRRLLDDPDLRGVSHVVVDEVPPDARPAPRCCTRRFPDSRPAPRRCTLPLHSSLSSVRYTCPLAFPLRPSVSFIRCTHPFRHLSVSFAVGLIRFAYRVSSCPLRASASITATRGAGARAERRRRLPPHRPPPPPGPPPPPAHRCGLRLQQAARPQAAPGAWASAHPTLPPAAGRGLALCVSGRGGRSGGGTCGLCS